METITLKIKDKTKFRHFMKLIEDLDYVEVLPKESGFHQNADVSGDGLMAIAGMWQDRDISSETLRAKAWPKRR